MFIGVNLIGKVILSYIFYLNLIQILTKFNTLPFFFKNQSALCCITTGGWAAAAAEYTPTVAFDIHTCLNFSICLAGGLEEHKPSPSVLTVGRKKQRIKERVATYSSMLASTPLIINMSLAPSPGGRKTSPLGKEGIEGEYLLLFKDILNNKKDIYRQLKGRSGVYLFTNNINHKMYVGSSITLGRRICAHLHYASANNSKNNQILYRAIKKYKIENFSLAILEFCTNDLSICAKVEQK